MTTQIPEKVKVKDPRFWEIFRHKMDIMGAPMPDSWIKALSLGFSTFGTICATLEKYPKKSIGEIAAILRLGLGKSTMAGLFADIAVVAGSMMASFYLGVLVGSLLTAVWEYTGRKYQIYINRDIIELVTLMEDSVPIQSATLKRWMLDSDVLQKFRSKGINFAMA